MSSVDTLSRLQIPKAALVDDSGEADADVLARSYLTASVYKVVLQKSITAQICQPTFYMGDHKG